MALVNRTFSVNVTPGMMPPIVHVSEYDVGRAYTVSILDEQGNTFTIPSGTTASIEGTLNGSVGFTQSATVSSNQVSFTLSESMTAYSGKAWCKIKLTQNSQPIQTCAFVLAVDRAGVEADTVIGAPGFEEQIQEAVEEWAEQQGFTSPTVTITPITGGNRVTFTDAQHPQGQSIDVMDGENGAEVDDTLTEEGMAADAAVVGEQLTIAAPDGTQTDIPITGYWWRNVAGYVVSGNEWGVEPTNNYHCYAFDIPARKNIEVSVSGTHNRFAILGKSDIIDAETVPTQTITGFTLIYRQDSESTYSFNSGSYRTIVLYLCAGINDQPTVSVIQKSNAGTMWLKDYVEDLADTVDGILDTAVLTSVKEYTTSEKATARTNIDAASLDDVTITESQEETTIQGTMWNASGYAQDASATSGWQVEADPSSKTYAFNAPAHRDVSIEVSGVHNRFVLLATQDSIDTSTPVTQVTDLDKVYRNDGDSSYSFNTGNYRSFFLYLVVGNSSLNPTVAVSISVGEGGTVQVPLKSVVAELEGEIEELSAIAVRTETLIEPTQTVKATAADYFAMWETLVTDGYCTKTQIATVNGQPIYKYVFAFDSDTMYGDSLEIVSDGSFYQKPKISFISGQHGDEKGSPLFLYEFMNRLCRNQAYAKYFGMFDFHVIPLVNPTGYNANTRNNYQNININRDGSNSPQTVEGQALKAHFDAYEWAACFDIHQMSPGHGTTHATHSCGYYNSQFGASKQITDKFNKLFCTVGYEAEKLLEAEYNKPHVQMFQPWDEINIPTWCNYPSNVANKTGLSFCFETAQTWAYYSDSGVDLNPVALIGGNTITDKALRIFLDNI